MLWNNLLGRQRFYKEIIKYEDLLNQFINFLKNQMGNLNHLIVSFYSKIIICFFVGLKMERFWNIWNKACFWRIVLKIWNFVSIFRAYYAQYQIVFHYLIIVLRVKQWYTNKSFMNQLFELFSIEQPTEIHENVAAIWVEFVKGLRRNSN